jgi:hypothetical protein
MVVIFTRAPSARARNVTGGHYGERYRVPGRRRSGAAALQGADPNRLVAVTDQLSATTLPTGESFKTLRTAKFGEVLRGVSLTPGSGADRDKDKDHDRNR